MVQISHTRCSRSAVWAIYEDHAWSILHAAHPFCATSDFMVGWEIQGQWPGMQAHRVDRTVTTTLLTCGKNACNTIPIILWLFCGRPWLVGTIENLPCVYITLPSHKPFKHRCPYTRPFSMCRRSLLHGGLNSCSSICCVSDLCIQSDAIERLVNTKLVLPLTHPHKVLQVMKSKFNIVMLSPDY